MGAGAGGLLVNTREPILQASGYSIRSSQPVNMEIILQLCFLYSADLSGKNGEALDSGLQVSLLVGEIPNLH